MNIEYKVHKVHRNKSRATQHQSVMLRKTTVQTSSYIKVALQFVEEQFNAVFENQVEEVQVCYNTSELDKLVAEYHSTFTKLQDQLDECIRLDKLRKKIKPQKVSHSQI